MKAAAGAAGRAATPGDTGGRNAPASARQTMRAIVQDTYGVAGVWRAEETARPAIGDGEVLVRVRAAGLDRGTWHLMAGQPYLMRLMGSGLRAPKNRVPGLDVAGTIVAAGAAVTRFGVGDEVFGISQGSFADYARARADKLTRKPANLTFDQAAAVAVSGLTALQGLRDAGQRATRPARADHRRIGRRRHVRRADHQGPRSAGHRRVQHGQDRPGHLDRRRPRPGLHPRRLRGRVASATTSSWTSPATPRWPGCGAR